jgi:hypothetical protein
MYRLILVLLAVIAFSLPAAQPLTDQREGFKKYRNNIYHYCVEYPAHWTGSESFTKNGRDFVPSDTTPYRLKPRIVVGAELAQPSRSKDGELQNLEERFEGILEFMKHEGNAVDLVVRQKKKGLVGGIPSLSTVVEYKETSSGHSWVLWTVTMQTAEGVVFFLELRCHPRDEPSLVPIFEHMQRTFALQCN